MFIKKSTMLFLFLFALLFFSGCSGNKLKGPAILFMEDIYNFGEVDEGAEVRHTFIFSNPGTKILTIEDITFSCWCIALEDIDRILRPGEEGKISVVLKTAGFKGDITKTITLKTNVPDTLPILTIEGKLRAGELDEK